MCEKLKPVITCPNKPTGHRPPDLVVYVLKQHFQSHSRVSMVAVGGLAPVWHRGICNNYINVGHSSSHIRNTHVLHDIMCAVGTVKVATSRYTLKYNLIKFENTSPNIIPRSEFETAKLALKLPYLFKTGQTFGRSLSSSLWNFRENE